MLLTSTPTNFWVQLLNWIIVISTVIQYKLQWAIIMHTHIITCVHTHTHLPTCTPMHINTPTHMGICKSQKNKNTQVPGVALIAKIFVNIAFLQYAFWPNRCITISKMIQHWLNKLWLIVAAMSLNTRCTCKLSYTADDLQCHLSHGPALLSASH